MGAAAHAEGKYVCRAHFDDTDLSALATEEEVDTQCSYCRRKRSAPLGKIVDRILFCMSLSYADASEVLPYDGREGGYQGQTYDTRDLLEGHIGLELRDDTYRDAILEDIVQSIDDYAWTELSYVRPSSSLIESWRRCCAKLRHGVRYFITGVTERSIEDAADDILSPPTILKEVTSLCAGLGLIRELPAGTKIYRAREQPPGKRYHTPLQLGPPPPQDAPSGRMSAAGIPVFYGAFDRQTALLESASRSGTLALGIFRTISPLRIVDLTALPAVPGYFSKDAPKRESIIFLRDFTQDISKPIERDERVHVEYVPSQVITEYFRLHFLPEGKNIDGIQYPSARHSIGSSVALFCTRANLVLSSDARRHIQQDEIELAGEDSWLKLIRTGRFAVEMLPSFTVIQPKPKKPGIQAKKPRRSRRSAE